VVELVEDEMLVVFMSVVGRRRMLGVHRRQITSMPKKNNNKEDEGNAVRE
jgi:hypothetical protein